MGCIYSKTSNVDAPDDECLSADNSNLPNGEGGEQDQVPAFKEYGLAELRTATKGFSPELIVSESGEKAPNVVYHGKLNGGRLVAVKRFSKLSSLLNLAVLNLSANRLSGTIPPQLALCAYLNVIDLHANTLSGFIPDQLGLLVRLSTFDVSYNQLSDPIPVLLANRSGGLPRLNASSFVGNKDLYGYPLPPRRTREPSFPSRSCFTMTSSSSTAPRT